MPENRSILVIHQIEALIKARPLGCAAAQVGKPTESLSCHSSNIFHAAVRQCCRVLFKRGDRLQLNAVSKVSFECSIDR